MRRMSTRRWPMVGLWGTVWSVVTTGICRARDEVEDRVAVLSAPDSVLVLDRDDPGVGAVEGHCHPEVVLAVIAPYPVAHFHRIRRRAVGRMQGHDRLVAGGGREVVRKGGDAASSRRVGGNEHVA